MSRIWAFAAALLLVALVGCSSEIIEPTPDLPTMPPTVPSPEDQT